MSGTWRERCADGEKCGYHNCPKCSETQILSPMQRGAKKPNRRMGAGADKDKGYRVTGWKADEVFSIPDLAIRAAKARAKKLQKPQVIMRDGVLWMSINADGSIKGEKT